jgi:hypothetical protein
MVPTSSATAVVQQARRDERGGTMRFVEREMRQNFTALNDLPP